MEKEINCICVKLEDSEDDYIKEFCDIIRLLVDRDLTILHQVLLLEDVNEQKRCIRNMRPSTLDGTLYNAYCAREIVTEPIIYVNNEIIFRFNQKFLIK